MKKYCALFCLTTVGAFLAFSDQAAAGNLLATDGPSFTPAGALSNNTAVLQQANSSLVQLFGQVSNQVAANRSVMLALGRTSPLAPVIEDAGRLTLRGDQKTGMQEAVTLVPLSLSATSSKASTFDAESAFPAKDGAAEMIPALALDAPNLSLDTASTLSLDMAPNLMADMTLLNVSTDSLDFEMTPTAIPEPSTYALVGFGLAALLFISRRRNSVRA